MILNASPPWSDCEEHLVQVHSGPLRTIFTQTSSFNNNNDDYTQEYAKASFTPGWCLVLWRWLVSTACSLCHQKHGIVTTHRRILARSAMMTGRQFEI